MAISLVHWKIRRDPFLSVLAERHGEDAPFKAGFFLDEDTEDAPLDDVDWLCTPRPRLLSSISSIATDSGKPFASKKPVVLLATGGFNPVHDGHLAMMEHAKEAASRAGFDVVGGYLSPGHDAYLKLKCGPAAIPASVRLAQIAHKIESSTWLSVDPWEALHRRVSVNYTDVVARLRAYLRHHFDPRIDVLYVCGADNARFGFAFSEDAGCVVVGRPGAENEGSLWRERLATNPRILWAEGHHSAASRRIRAETWIDDRKPRLVVRLEDMRALRTLSRNGENASISVAWLLEFQRALVGLIGKYATVKTAPVANAQHDPSDNIISLDALLPAKHNLALSRLFALGGYSPLGHVARPGADPLADQVAKISGGSFVLADDDSMTGSTLRAVRELLPETVSIEETRVAVRHSDDEEVVDSRDFLLGADDGGLVVELTAHGGGAEASIGRAPYILPYVDPSPRASVRADVVHAFSKSIWQLNERMFRETNLRVRDLPAPTRRTFAFLGDDKLLADVCEWHAKRLTS